MRTLREALALYARIGRTYLAWAPVLLALSAMVFLPLGLIDALSAHADIEAIDLNNGIKLFVLALAVSSLTATSLLGEVFYSGAIAISLTHPSERGRPGVREIVGSIAYGRLIAVDIAYVVIVAAGTVFFIVPGILAFVFLGLAGPVVELEKRGVRAALLRSFHLVRGHFWLVSLVLAPIEVLGDALGEGILAAVHALMGETFLATWLGETLSNMALSPVFAIAAVLLTVELIAARGDAAPRLRSSPATAPQAALPR